MIISPSVHFRAMRILHNSAPSTSRKHTHGGLKRFRMGNPLILCACHKHWHWCGWWWCVGDDDDDDDVPGFQFVVPKLPGAFVPLTTDKWALWGLETALPNYTKCPGNRATEYPTNPLPRFVPLHKL